MKILSAVRLPGKDRRAGQTFDAGQESALAKAASPEQLAYLQERGAIQGFGVSGRRTKPEPKKETPKAETSKGSEAGTNDASTDADPGAIPEGFPYADILAEAEITTIEQAQAQRESDDGLEGVSGLGKVRAKKVAEALDELTG